MHLRIEKVVLENVGRYRGVRVERDFSGMPDGLIRYQGRPGAGKTTEMSLSSIGTWYQWDPNRGDPMEKFTNPGAGLVEIHGWAQGRLYRWVVEYTVREISRGAKKGQLDKSRRCTLYEWRDGAWVVDPACASGQISAFLEKNEALFGPREYMMHSVYAFQRGGARRQRQAESFDESEPKNRKRFFRDLLGLDTLSSTLETATARCTEAERELDALSGDLQRLEALDADLAGLVEQGKQLTRDEATIAESLDALRAVWNEKTAAYSALLALRDQSAELERQRERLREECSARLRLELAATDAGLATGAKRTEVAACERTVAEVQRRLDDARTAASAADQAKRRWEEAQARLASTNADLAQRRAELAAMTAPTEQLRTAIQAATAEMPIAQAAEASAKQALDIARQRLSVATMQADMLQKATEAVTQLRSTKTRAGQSADSARQSMVSAQAKLERAQATTVAASRQVDELAQLHSQQDAAVEAKRAEWMAAQDAKTKAQEAYHVANQGHVSARNHTAQAESQAKAFAESTAPIALERLAERQRAASMLERVPCHGAGEFAGCELLKAAIAAKAEIPSLEAALAAAEQQLADATQRVESLRIAESASKEAVDAALEAFQAATDNADRIRREGAAMKAELDAIASRLAERRVAAQAAQQADAQARAEISAAEASLAIATAESDSATRGLQEAEAHLASLPVPDPDIAKAEHSAQQQAERAANAVDALASTMSRAGELQQLVERSSALEAQVANLERSIAEQTASLPPAPDASALAGVTAREADLAMAAASASVTRLELTRLERQEAAAQERLASSRTVAAIDADLASLPVVTAPTDDELRATEADVNGHQDVVQTVENKRGELQQARAACVGAQGQVESQIAAMAETRGRAVALRDLVRLRTEVCYDLQAVIKYKIEAAGPEVSAHANQLLQAAFGDRWAIEIVTETPNKSNSGSKERYEIMIHERDPERARVCLLEDLSGGEQSIVRLALQLGVALWRNGQSRWRAENVWLDEPDASLDDGFRQPLQVMLRQFLHAGGFSRVFFTSHGLAIEADHIIDVEDRSAWRFVSPGSAGTDGSQDVADLPEAVA